MQIRFATQTDAPTWDTYVLNHPHSNPYLLSGWSRAISSAYGHKLYQLMATDTNGNTTGTLPLVHIKHPIFGNTLFSMPYADLGGVIADDDQIATALIEQATQIASDNKIPVIELRQGSELNHNTGSFYQSAASAHKVRMVLDLPETADVLMAGFKAKLRSQIRRPQKDGLTTVSGGMELLDDFYRVFAENMRDLGSPVHAKKFIAAVLSEFAHQARIFLVHKNDEVYAVSITLGCGNTLYNPWASSLRRHSASSPNMLLYWAMLEYACDHGFKRFDFGRSTPGEGTFKFKQQWGAVEVPLHWLALTRTLSLEPSSSQQKSKFEMAMQLWQKLPVSLTKVVGPPLRKYIGL
ncbi:FemAB family XrtA/PEP-CTERM system-associated protein [Pelovirga terrestris]|uniref:FemAB family PEP-CTERM system-associated protein n=1 Tax=Pelovirga terrestris TaxID=2771352 RepID=A0A8J6QK43_9BACT|nr:FemAB family XrtA/PEP-CTERM system-associated protein [Pelovirga terrestris]MBD1399619.1 FemAB family PEP-CTERM system-associated protein [Pelovirga terrestris]